MKSIFKVLFIIHRIIWTVKRHAKYDEYLSTVWILSKSQCAFKSITWLNEFGNILDIVNVPIYLHDDRQIIPVVAQYNVRHHELSSIPKEFIEHHKSQIKHRLFNELFKHIKENNLVEIQKTNQLHLGYTEYRATINIVEARK